jgi:hypothetical protein
MDKSLVKNAADESQVKEAAQKEKRGRELELDDMRVLLSTVSGRRFLWGLLGRCGVFRETFAGSDFCTTAFNEGRRNIGLALLSDVNEADPEKYLVMMNEAKKRN